MAQKRTFEIGSIIQGAFEGGVTVGYVRGFEDAQRESSTRTVSVEQTQVAQVCNPIASLLGKYSDEPLWDGFEEALKTIRNEENTIRNR